MKTNILIVLVLLLGACQVEHTQQWDGVFANGFRQGTGTLADPYLIASAQELAGLAKAVNEGRAFGGKYFRLANNLDMNGGSSQKCYWPGIGGNTVFQGIFDGNGCQISNIRISAEGLQHPSGLFGKIGEYGKVYALKVANIGCTVCTSIYKGGIAGTNMGIIADCGVMGVENMNGGITGNNSGTVSGCYSGGKLDEVNGGIACDNYGTIRNCLSKGNIFCSGAFVYVGGICGTNSNTVDACAFVGTVKTGMEGFAGGIAGNQDNRQAVIQNCYNRGTVKGDRRGAGITCGSAGAIKNCYSAGTGGAPIVSSVLAGIENTYYDNHLYYRSWGGTARSAAFLKSQAFVRLLNCGKEDGPWGMDIEGKNQGYPVLRNINY